MRVLSSVSCFCPRYPLRTGLVRPVHGVSGGRVQSPRRRRERSPSPRFDSDAAVADAAGRVPSPRRHHERSPRLYSHSPGWPPAAVATGTLHPRSRSKTPPPNLRPNATALSSTPTSTSDSDCDADAAHRVSSPRRNQSAPKPMIYSGRGSRVATSGMATYSEAEAMADAWEKEKMAKIKKQYNETMDTIADWEAEKKAKARRDLGVASLGKILGPRGLMPNPKAGTVSPNITQSDSERKHAKVLEYYKDEMSRINKVVAASRLTAEEKRRNAETKVREKADKVDGEASLDLWLLLKPCVHPPSTCGC